MKITTFNVNGLKAILKRTNCGLRDFLDRIGGDVICLQETKTSRTQLSEDLAITEDYIAFFSFSQIKDGYSGVVTFCKDTYTPLAAEEGLTGALTTAKSSGIGCYPYLEDTPMIALDSEGRAVLTEHQLSTGQRLVVVNVYCPHVEQGNLERMDYKLAFYHALEKRCESLHEAGKLVVVVGDINCSYDVIDSAYALEDPSGFTDSPSRQWFRSFVKRQFTPKTESSLSNWYLVDAFRALNPSDKGAYTCWSTVTSARATNYGTRLDYILVDPDLQPSLLGCTINSQVLGSDHCPVSANLNVTVSSSKSVPLLSSKHFAEFIGKQKTLQDYFKLHPFSSKRQSADTSPPANKVMKLCSEVSSTHTASYLSPGSVNTATMSDGGISSSVMPAVASCVTISTSGVSVPTSVMSNTTSGVSAPTSVMSNTTSGVSAPTSVMSNTTSGVSAPTSVMSNTTSGVSAPTSAMSNTTSGVSAPTSVMSNTTSGVSAPTSVMSGSRPQPFGCHTLLKGEWRNILKGLPPPPLCSGHKEKTVLRTVKKDGPNKFRRFYVCARPAGAKNNPLARCDFFQWLDGSGGTSI